MPMPEYRALPDADPGIHLTAAAWEKLEAQWPNPVQFRIHVLQLTQRLNAGDYGSAVPAIVPEIADANQENLRRNFGDMTGLYDRMEYADAIVVVRQLPAQGFLVFTGAEHQQLLAAAAERELAARLAAEQEVAFGE